MSHGASAGAGKSEGGGGDILGFGGFVDTVSPEDLSNAAADMVGTVGFGGEGGRGIFEALTDAFLGPVKGESGGHGGGGESASHGH